MKNLPSLKIEIPSVEELDRARDEISKKLKSWKPAHDKIYTIYQSESAAERGEYVIEQIVTLLGVHSRPEMSKIGIHNYVVLACGQIPKPISAKIEDKKIKELAVTANELLRRLRDPELIPYYIARVFGSMQNRNEWIDKTEGLASLSYQRLPPNTDPAKRACVYLAYVLITKCTTQKPSGTAGGLFRTVAGLLHQFACPTNEEIVDLRTGCDEVLRRVKAGVDIEKDGW